MINSTDKSEFDWITEFQALKFIFDAYKKKLAFSIELSVWQIFHVEFKWKI